MPNTQKLSDSDSPDTQTKTPKKGGRPKKDPLVDLKAATGAIKISPHMLLSKQVRNLDAAIQQQPVETVESILTNSVAVLTVIANSILKEAVGDGQIMDSNMNVKRLLRDKNYLAFSTAQRQAASQLLALQKYKDKRADQEKREAAKQKPIKPSKQDDLDILLS